MIESSKIPSSVLSVYFSKENIGVSHFDKQNLKIQCGLIQYFIFTSHALLQKLINQRAVQLIITNNDKHNLLSKFAESTKIIRVDEKGLQDDIIENNLSVFKFNPIKDQISNKQQYFKLMKDHSQSNGLQKEKYKSLGILLYFLLNQNDFSLTSRLYLNDFDYFFDKIFKHVQISTSEQQSLQIIKQQIHPSLIKGKGRSKQGFSLLSLYESPLSSTGSKKIIRNIFRNPTYDIKVIESRLNMISWLKKHDHNNKALVKLFRSIHTIDSLLIKFGQSRVEDEVWHKLVKTLQSMIIIHKLMQQKLRLCEQGQIPQLINNYFRQINWNDIALVLSTITSTLDLQLSYGAIRRGVDLELDELKKTYDNLPHLLTLYARQQNWADDFRIVFMSQIGYLILVPHEVEIAPQFQPQKWNLQFAKRSGKFYCNDLTLMLDEQYGDIYGCITDKEKKIMFELENLVSQYYETIELAYWRTCQLQCYVGISIISNGMCRPRPSSQALIVSKSWHLLLAQEAIENHIFSIDQLQAPTNKVWNSQQNLVNTHYSNRMMLISGPNGSGKTIYMKQVAIVIYLMHLGFYVPAQFAQLPIVDKLSLVQSKRSIYRGNDGFQSELLALAKIMNSGMLTNKSVVLIDQLGASIDNVLAKKMLAAVLRFLSQARQSNININQQLTKASDKFQIPLTIAITHLTDAMANSMIKQQYLLRYLTMDMQKDETCLFKIKPGLVKKGYGIQCAKQFMDEQFIDRAKAIWETIKYK